MRYLKLFEFYEPTDLIEEIDMSLFMSLDDERNSVGIGDDVLVLYFNNGYELFRFELEELNPGMGERYGYTNGDTWYGLDMAIRVLSVETYNDFVTPNRTI